MIASRRYAIPSRLNAFLVVAVSSALCGTLAGLAVAGVIYYLKQHH